MTTSMAPSTAHGGQSTGVPPAVLASHRERTTASILSQMRTSSAADPTPLSGVGLYTHVGAAAQQDAFTYPHQWYKFLPLERPQHQQTSDHSTYEPPEELLNVYEEMKALVQQEEEADKQGSTEDPREKYGCLDLPDIMVPPPPPLSLQDPDDIMLDTQESGVIGEQKKDLDTQGSGESIKQEGKQTNATGRAPDLARPAIPPAPSPSGLPPRPATSKSHRSPSPPSRPSDHPPRIATAPSRQPPGQLPDPAAISSAHSPSLPPPPPLPPSALRPRPATCAEDWNDHHGRKRSRSPSPYRKRSRSPSPYRKRSRSPSPYRRRYRSSSPYRGRSRSPSPYRKRSRSPSFYRKQRRHNLALSHSPLGDSGRSDTPSPSSLDPPPRVVLDRYQPDRSLPPHDHPVRDLPRAATLSDECHKEPSSSPQDLFAALQTLKIRCLKCALDMHDIRGLTTHLVEVHSIAFPRIWFQCCDLKGTPATQTMAHLERVHGWWHGFPCPVCRGVSQTLPDLHHHIRQHVDSLPRCYDCERLFVKRASKETHDCPVRSCTSGRRPSVPASESNISSRRSHAPNDISEDKASALSDGRSNRGTSAAKHAKPLNAPEGLGYYLSQLDPRKRGRQ